MSSIKGVVRFSLLCFFQVLGITFPTVDTLPIKITNDHSEADCGSRNKCWRLFYIRPAARPDDRGVVAPVLEG